MYLMLYLLFICIIFFFKQKTAYEMRISDWSSDVCSSDLAWSCAIADDPPDAVSKSAAAARSLVAMFRFFFIIFKDSRLILTRVARPFVTHTRRKVNPFCREICELMPSRSRTSHEQRQFSSFSLWISPIRDHASPASAGKKRMGGRGV